jgi:hypothetical protein
MEHGHPRNITMFPLRTTLTWVLLDTHTPYLVKTLHALKRDIDCLKNTQLLHMKIKTKIIEENLINFGSTGLNFLRKGAQETHKI